MKLGLILIAITFLLSSASHAGRGFHAGPPVAAAPVATVTTATTFGPAPLVGLFAPAPVVFMAPDPASAAANDLATAVRTFKIAPKISDNALKNLNKIMERNQIGIQCNAGDGGGSGKDKEKGTPPAGEKSTP